MRIVYIDPYAIISGVELIIKAQCYSIDALLALSLHYVYHIVVSVTAFLLCRANDIQLKLLCSNSLMLWIIAFVIAFLNSFCDDF